jgi:hypothetical protein
MQRFGRRCWQMISTEPTRFKVSLLVVYQASDSINSEVEPLTPPTHTVRYCNVPRSKGSRLRSQKAWSILPDKPYSRTTPWRIKALARGLRLIGARFCLLVCLGAKTCNPLQNRTAKLQKPPRLRVIKLSQTNVPRSPRRTASASAPRACPVRAAGACPARGLAGLRRQHGAN